MKHLSGLVSIILLFSVSHSAIADKGDKGIQHLSSIFDALISVIVFNHETINTLFSGNGNAVDRLFRRRRGCSRRHGRQRRHGFSGRCIGVFERR